MATLCKICGHQALLPKSVQIPLCYDRTGTPLYGGGYATVWEGEHGGRKVAVKVLTIFATCNLDNVTRVGCRYDHPYFFALGGLTASYRGFAGR